MGQGGREKENKGGTNSSKSEVAKRNTADKPKRGKSGHVNSAHAPFS